MFATFLAVALVGVFGCFLGSEIGLPEIGSVLAIATGICIMESSKHKVKSDQGQ